MTCRFLAAAGHLPARRRLGERLRAAARQPLTTTQCAGLISIWTEAGAAVLMASDDSALAVGRIFDRATGKRLQSLPPAPDLAEILTRDCWGSYVLFASHGDAHLVMRDPSGSIPVYYGEDAGLQLYASDSDMLRLAWAEPLRPDLETARHWLTFPFLRTSRTGLAGVGELLPGMLREVNHGQARLRPAWRPQLFCTPDCAIPTFDEATTLLRDAIVHCVPRAAVGQANLVLQLSGGLDSSIVAAALAESGTPFRAVTFATSAADGDERRYARAVAAHFGIDLVELAEADLDTSARMRCSPLQRPPSPLLQPLRLAQSRAAGPGSVILDGGGGDNLFASINTAGPAIDALRSAGMGQALRALGDLASRHGCTVWAAASSALRRARRPPMIPWPADTSFIHADARPKADAHPWLMPDPDLPPGKADHLRLIAGIQHFLSDPAAGEPLNVHPLVCQPLLELCLRIPSWLWISGGRDRAVARAAFRAGLPGTILDRRGKGSLQSYFVKGFQAQRELWRELLVDGHLARAGIVDSDAVASFLGKAGEPRDNRHIRVLELASAEQWLRSFG